MTKIYISGKISGEDLQDCENKFRDFELNLITNLIKRCQENPEESFRLEIANPFTFNRHLIERGDATWLDYMRNAISILAYCDEAHFLPDWKDSRGAKIEHQLCIDLGIKIVYG